ncbi:hypothetical protein Tco_0775429 [Tanacetum coccineum]
MIGRLSTKHYALMVLMLPSDSARQWHVHESEVVEVVADQRRYEDNTIDAAHVDDSKVGLQRVLETRKAVLQREQAMVYARALVAGFETDDLARVPCNASHVLSDLVDALEPLALKQQRGMVEIVSTSAPASGALIIIDDDGPDMHYMGYNIKLCDSSRWYLFGSRGCSCDGRNNGGYKDATVGDAVMVYYGDDGDEV